MDILLPVFTLGILGLLFGLGLAGALKVFLVKVDPRIEQVLAALPGSNCGACGKAGCLGLAQALAKGEAQVEDCAPGGHEVHERVGKILGLEVKAEVKKVAILLCDGGTRAVDRFQYKGVKDCNAADLLFGGQKGCEYGCLGFGSCEKACPFGAIKMGQDGLPVIDRDRCTACQRCVEVCPKDLFTVIPQTSKVWVRCNSPQKAPEVRKVCKSGCNGCGKCVKVCEPGAITIEENLAKIDYQKCTNCGKCVEACPTGVIVKID